MSVVTINTVNHGILCMGNGKWDALFGMKMSSVAIMYADGIKAKIFAHHFFLKIVSKCAAITTIIAVEHTKASISPIMYTIATASSSY